MKSNKFSTFIDDLDKYSSSKGDESLLYEMLNAMSMKRHAKCNSKWVRSKTNVSMTRIIQPIFLLLNIEAGNDSSRLHCRFFYYALKVGYSNHAILKDIKSDSYFKLAKF